MIQQKSTDQDIGKEKKFFAYLCTHFTALATFSL